MDFADFLREILGITQDFGINKIEKFEEEKVIKIHLIYLPKCYKKADKKYTLYDHLPERDLTINVIWFVHCRDILTKKEKRKLLK